MTAEKISVAEMQEEVAAMLKVCFEGTVVKLGNMLELTLTCGRSFLVTVEES